MLNEKEIFKSSDDYKIIIGENEEAGRKGMLAARIELPFGAEIELGHFPAKQLLLMKQEFDTTLAQAVNQYNAVVLQNQSLQQELSSHKNKIVDIALFLDELKQRFDYIADFEELNQIERIIRETNPENLTHTEELKKKIVEFLTEMSSQNNRGTRFPYYFSIVDFNDNFEQDDKGEFFFESSSGSFLEIVPVLRERYDCGLIVLNEDDDFEKILQNIGTWEEDDRINEWLEEHNYGIVQRFRNEPVSWSDGVFFTEKDAEAYLESVRNHHSSEAKTYVDVMNKWGRSSQTEEFLTNLFNYFGVKVPPELFYENKKKEGAEQC